MSRGNVDIRELDAEDIERIGEITVDAWRPVYEGYRENMGDDLFEAKHGDWRERKAEEVKSQCRDRPDTVRVAEVEDSIAGFVTFSIDRTTDTGEIGNNAVAPEFQRRGVATTMYRHVLAEFRERGLRFAEVTTGLDDAHEPARHAYEKMGFDIERPTVTYWQEL